MPKYWPTPYSINSSGIPISNIINAYGIKKAPAKIKSFINTTAITTTTMNKITNDAGKGAKISKY